MRAAGGLEAVEGITLERWAAFNAAIFAGASFQDLIKGAGIDPARWQRVAAVWTERMSKDDTFAVATAYGNAFNAASHGKYAAHAKDAIAARAGDRDLALALPISYEQFFDILFEQGYAFVTGKDPQQTLRDLGLTVVDWTDLGAVMGYQLNRHGARDAARITAASEAAQAKAAARYPAVKSSDVDIVF